MGRTVELIPQVGVVVDGVTVCLEATRAEVERALGAPGDARWNSLYYFDNELRVDLDEEGCVEFIELLGGPDGELQPVVYGLEAFQADPEAVVELLKEKNGADFVDAERGCSYTFRKLGVGLYRQALPADVAELIEEARADGHPLNDEEIEREKRRTHWATIGVSVEYYYI